MSLSHHLFPSKVLPTLRMIPMESKIISLSAAAARSVKSLASVQVHALDCLLARSLARLAMRAVAATPPPSSRPSVFLALAESRKVRYSTKYEHTLSGRTDRTARPAPHKGERGEEREEKDRRRRTSALTPPLLEYMAVIQRLTTLMNRSFCMGMFEWNSFKIEY